MRFDSLHCALLALVVLLAVYVARGYGLFKEGKHNHQHTSLPALSPVWRD